MYASITNDNLFTLVNGCLLVGVWKMFIFISVIGALVFVHEFGHFLIAKLCGVGVLRFSLGFGRAIIKFRKAETEYQISWIPLGGYVRMIGDMPDGLTGEQATDDAVRSSDDVKPNELEQYTPEIQAMIEDKRYWFIEKSVWVRSAIVAAGPIANLLFAFFLWSLSASIYGAIDINTEPVIGGVQKNSPAEVAGLREGDRVIKIGDVLINAWETIPQVVTKSGGATLMFTVERNGERLSLAVTPKLHSIQGMSSADSDAQTPRFMAGMSAGQLRKEVGILEAMQIGFRHTVDMTMATLSMLLDMLTGRISAKESLAGPVFIFNAASEHADKGFDYLLGFMAILSVSLGVLNLLPIPVLDGGHLLFFLIESITGPISIQKKEIAQQVGMVLLLCLMGFAVTNDFMRGSTPTEEVGVEWKEHADKVIADEGNGSVSK